MAKSEPKPKADADTVRVKVTSAWSGHGFNHGHGAIIDLPRDVAEARIAAGLCEQAPDGAEVRPAFNPDNAQDLYLESERQLGVAKDQIVSLTAERDDLKAKLETALAEIETLTKPKA